MANVVITVSEKGSATVKRSLKSIGETSKKSSDAVNVLRRALAALGGVLAIRKIVRSADAYTNLQNRLKLVTSGSAQLEAVTGKLFSIAQETRNAFKATGEFYARTALAAKDLGKSQNQLLKFTELTNKAIATSGVTAEEAASGLIQLSQGISSNRLAGDELRSVLENIPAVADAIARGLGTTRGELRRLAAEGKLTASVIIEAILKDGETVNKQFDKISITIGQALTKIDNSFIKLIGSFKGASGTVAGVLSTIADNFELIAKAAAIAAVAVLTKFIPVIAISLIRAVGLTTRSLLLLRIAMASAFSGNILKSIRAIRLAVVSLNVALIANPIGIIVAAVAAAITALTLFRDNIIFVKDEALTLGDIMSGVWGLIKLGAKAAFDVIGQVIALFNIGFTKLVIDPVSSLINKFAELGDVFTSVFRFMLRVATKTINFILQGMDTLINAPIRALNELNKIAGLDLIKEVNVIGGIKDFSKSLLDGLVEVTTVVRDTVLSAAGNAKDVILKGARERAAARNVKVNPNLDKSGVDKLSENARASFLAKVNKEIAEEIRLTGLLSKERKIEIELSKILSDASNASIKLTKEDTVALRNNLVELANRTEAMTVMDRILKRVTRPQQEFSLGVTGLDKALDKGLITLDRYNKEFRNLRVTLLDNNTDLASGAERALLKIDTNVNDLASTVEDTLVNAFSAASDALTQFVATGKLDFNSLMTSIIADITRLALQKAVLGPLFAAFGGGGGIFSSLKGLFGAQHGGTGIVGGTGGTDSQVVAFKATPGERVDITPAGSRSGSGGSIEITNIFQISTPDAESFMNAQTQGQIEQQLAQSANRALDRNS